MMQQRHRSRAATGVGRLLCLALLPLLAFAPAMAQEGSAGAPSGRMFVPELVMNRYCVTRVTPDYPSGLPALTAPAAVALRVVVQKSGRVEPLYRVDGPRQLEAAAMDAVRLWRYSPYFRDGQPIDVATDVHVEFEPGRPGGLITHTTK